MGVVVAWEYAVLGLVDVVEVFKGHEVATVLVFAGLNGISY